jgi:hypothetical protein
MVSARTTTATIATAHDHHHALVDHSIARSREGVKERYRGEGVAELWNSRATRPSPMRRRSQAGRAPPHRAAMTTLSW